VVERAGALFAVFMSFRLAWRLAPPHQRVLAGLVAAATLMLTRMWLHDNGLGYAEGLMVALCLLAVDRHLDGHRGQAFALLVASGLVRVEIWPFVLAYAAWLWQAHAVRRGWLAFGVALLPVLWFGGDWLGSGSLTTGADRALARQPNTPGVSAHPALAVLKETLTLVPWPVWAGVACAVALAAARRRSSTDRVVLWLFGIGLAWTAIIAAMAQRGYAGVERFLFIAAAIEGVLAGVGFAWLVAAGERAPRARRAVVATAAVALITLFAFGSVPNAKTYSAQASDVAHIAKMDVGLARAVHRAGGPAKVLRCGHPTTAWFTVTALAWDLRTDPTNVTPIGPSRVEFRPHDGRWLLRHGACLHVHAHRLAV
jgi:hypothetical protein